MLIERLHTFSSYTYSPTGLFSFFIGARAVTLLPICTPSLCLLFVFRFALKEPAFWDREKKSNFRLFFSTAGKAASRQIKKGQSKFYLKCFEFSRDMHWGLPLREVTQASFLPVSSMGSGIVTILIGFFFLSSQGCCCCAWGR